MNRLTQLVLASIIVGLALHLLDRYGLLRRITRLSSRIYRFKGFSEPRAFKSKQWSSILKLAYVNNPPNHVHIFTDLIQNN